jgi:amino acid adenylation domain-containing protein
VQAVIEGFRPSPQQRRALAVGRARGGAGQGACLALALDGALDADRLRAALAAVVAGAEVLRTRLVRDPRSGVPLQVIGADAPSWAADADWRELSPAEVRRRVGEWAASALSRPVDAAEPPLVRAALHRLAGGGHLLRVDLPAALADAASMGMLAARLAAAYAGAPDGGEDEVQFADVAEWVNEFLDSDEAAEGRRHWKQRLASARAAWRLPMESPAAAGGGTAPRLVPVPVDAELLARLTSAAAAAGVPAPTFAMAAWTALVHRLTAQPEVRLAASFDGRGFEEMRGALGPFARQLPVSVDVAAETTVAALAKAVGRALAEAERWQDAFDAPHGDEPVAPLGFAWQPLPSAVHAGGIEWSVREALACTEPFRAALLCTVDGARLDARLLADPAHLSAEAAERLAEQVASVLHGAAANVETTVGALPVMGARERSFVLQGLAAGGPNEAGEGETVLARILDAAAADPGREAIRWEDGVMTYGELAERVRVLAPRLRAAGVGPEVRAGILLDRTGDAVVAMLAVMASGGAYVPLDGAYPRERLSYMLRDSGAAVLLTDAARADLAAGAGCRALLVVGADPVDAARPAGAAGADVPVRAARPENAAYVIYTSGTTGRPKGTVIEHRALARYVRAASAALELPGGAQYAVVSTLAADLGATMLFPALCLGGTLHLVGERRATDPEAWAEYAARHSIGCLKVVPSHLRLLLEGASPERALPRLRLVLGGESAEAELVERVHRLAPGLRVFNHYGPTETTVGVVAGELAGEDGGRPALGRPLPGARVYLLDTEGRPVPAGVPGEVHVGGDTVARGYLGRPALTAGRFVPDPFSAAGGARMYRTGDRARWRADGRLEFLGRLDHQVKVNGWRVEPGEVEAALADHPAVATARVLPREEDGGVRLVAYVVPAEGAEMDADALRVHLRGRLPEPFVPADFVSLARLPLTPNGKIDLRALPDPAQARAAAPRPHVAPRTPVEASLVEVWRSVLNRPGVGVTDDFFDLGGNSFLAVRLMSRIQKEFGRRLPLAALIGAGTVEGVAALLGEGGAESAPGHLVEIRAGGGALAPLFCVHPGEGTVLCYRELARHLDPERPVYGLQALDFELGRAPLVRIEEMAARYVDAITERFPDGPYLLAGWSFGGLVAFEAARQLAARGADVERVLLLDCRLPVTGPALGTVDATLFRLSLLFHGSRLVRDGGPVVTPDELRGLDIHAQLKLVAERQGIAVEQLYPAHVPPDRVDAYLEIRVARTRGILEYGWTPAPVAATLFRAGEVELDTAFPELAQSYLDAAATPAYGWDALAEGPVDVVNVPGTHHTMFAEPHVRVLARAVETHLAAPPAAARTAAAD